VRGSSDIMLNMLHVWLYTADHCSILITYLYFVLLYEKDVGVEIFAQPRLLKILLLILYGGGFHINFHLSAQRRECTFFFSRG
jgi:hypothetical protein